MSPTGFTGPDGDPARSQRTGSDMQTERLYWSGGDRWPETHKAAIQPERTPTL